jgi:hypothetical protein
MWVCGVIDGHFNFLIKGRQQKLVNEDKIMSHFNPIMGNKYAPVSEEHVELKFEQLQSKAKEVASFPGKEDSAINESKFKNMNIPIKLNIIP